MRTRQSKPFSRLKPKLRPGVRFRPETQGAIIFDSATMGIYATNRTGLLILNKLDGRTSCGKIVERLQRHFGSPSKRTLRNDLRRFLEDLVSVRLLSLEL